MSEINRALGAEAEPFKMPVNGKVYKLSPRSQKIIGAFEEYLEAGVRKRIYATEGQVSPDSFAAALLEFAERQETGYYEITKPYANKIMETWPARIHFFWLFLREHQPTMTEADVEKLIKEHPQAVAAALAELNGTLKNSDAPEPQAEAEGAKTATTS